MTGGDAGGPPPIDPAVGEHLQLIADALTELVGFRAAIINVARGDTMVVVAVSGLERAVSVQGVEHTRDDMLGTEWPVAVLLDDIAPADDWGRFKFIPHDRGSDTDGFGWIPDLPVSDDPGAWHPHDLLIAPIYDADGVVRGSIAVDDPVSGRVPDEQQRRHLERYARIGERVVLLATEQERLAERNRLGRAAREVLRGMSGQRSLDGVAREGGDLMMTTFGLSALCACFFRDDRPPVPWMVLGCALPHAEHVAAVVEQTARSSWQSGILSVVSRGAASGVDRAGAAVLQEYAAAHGLGSLVLLPLGAGLDCFGSLMLARDPLAPAWSEAELEEVLEISRDLGRMVASARAYQAEEELVRRLRSLDAERRELVATVSHELKNPLTSARVNLELIDRPDLDPALARGVQAARRGLRRMEQVIEDLQLLSRADAPARTSALDGIDLGALVDDVCGLNADWARSREVSLVTDLVVGVMVPGDAEQLRRVAANLVSNGVKYSRPGGVVTVAVRVGGTKGAEGRRAELVVADTGIGMSVEDQQAAFGEFYRSADPVVRSESGTGLGLAIVDRIVRNHGGEVGVDSELGRGSTFWVQLPLA